jgi:hypothetical protein
MVFSTVNLYVGVATVSQLDFIKALFGDLSIEMIDDKLKEFDNFIDYLNESLLDGSSLKAQELTHDVNTDCPIVIGLDRGTMCVNSRYSGGNQAKPTVAFNLADLETARKEFEAAVVELEKTQPVLAALVKGRPGQVIFVQNDCACCS